MSGQPFKALAAFTGSVKDPGTGKEYTKAGMNGLGDTKVEMEIACRLQRRCPSLV